MTFEYDGWKCAVEVFTNEQGLVAQFFDPQREPKEGQLMDYVYVDAGYGYISLKRKGKDGIVSGLLKRVFFKNSDMLTAAIEFVIRLLPDMDDAHIPYNLERIIVADAQVYTGETFQDVKEE